MTWLRRRTERRLLALEEYRQARRLIVEDVTVFGEQLTSLHVEMLTTELDREMRLDYQRSLDLYDEAKAALSTASAARDTAGLAAVEKLLDDGRWRLACVLARRDGLEPPARREPCFFNPQHGPAVEDLAWAPPGGTEREIGVCRADARRITGGEDPEIRLVRVGDRYVPWYVAAAPSPGSSLSGTLAAVTGGRAHVVRGDARITADHIAEAQARAGLSNLGGGGGGLGV
jgi:hypothetical protein